MSAHLRGTYGSTSVIRLRQLTIKFDTYKKRHDQNIKQHLRVMSNMIASLKSVGHEHLKVNLTNNDIIKTFSKVNRHAELEDERLGAAKAASNAFVAESSGTKSSGFKCKNIWKRNGKYIEIGEGPSNKKEKPNSKKGKRFFKKRDKRKMKCYNCQVLGYLARECTEPKKT
ncbi:hypothetical protein KY290_023709 [Solanum tuberosum]|uniref:CCHC-type domain-containing protein n=1 Tax=Solanum tuberosum TaxID=4113 RepID=A0ABQ7V876_SOLTU|nr:hypothetical protein KY284_022060 [Solanum tuberosum]KAH0683001.1 hypothetical protein KY289_020753 [Solanum tuberosum]KAH0760216.1 hypothetical protein KY290_023709 [Solanum tuberosum]